ncbi:MAG: hypothetical protein QOI76_632 [Frankiales bacterium]|nr:hypothetical protein [Frankiales bacterium]
MSLTHVPDLDSLELLIRVAATGSLGQAAAEHGISQPAVSARVKSMERLVGFPLVSRGARGSTLTAEGALLAGWAREVLHAADILDAGISSLRQDRQTRLRVAASLTVAEYLLPRWLVRLAASHPDTAVRLSAMNSAEVAAAVLSGGVDLGFVEGPRVAAGLDSQVVGRDRLVVVVPPAHPWARLRRPLDPTTLAHTRLVQREPLSGTRTALELALRSHAPLATPLLELSSTSAVRGAVSAGAGPAVLSDLAVRDDVAAGRVVVVPVRDLDLSRSLRAVWPRGQRPTGSARDLLTITRTTDVPGSVGRVKNADGKMGG